MKSVLCSGHALGQLPQIYSEKWARFSEQRLSKDEAMLIFDADAWISVQFFHNDENGQPSISKKMRRPRSASNISEQQKAEHREINKGKSGGDSLWPPLNGSLDSQEQIFQFGFTNSSANPNTTAAARYFGSERPILVPKVPSARHQSTGPPTSKTSTTAGRPMPGVVEPLFKSNSLEDKTSAKSNSEHTDASALLSARIANLGITTNEPSLPDDDTLSQLLKKANDIMRSGGPVSAQNDHHAKVSGPSASKSAGHAPIQTHSQDAIDRNLIKEMISVYPPRDCVYIRKSWKRHSARGKTLIKIGKGIDDPDLEDPNKARIDIGCKFQALNSVLVDLIYVVDPERAVKLVYAELENFRAKLDCQHQQPEATGNTGEQAHDKWFDIPEDVAIESVRRWCGFIQEVYNSAGTIKDKWTHMANSLPNPSRSEIVSLEIGFQNGDEKSLELHHELRNSRYKQWIRNGRSSNKHMDLSS